MKCKGIKVVELMSKGKTPMRMKWGNRLIHWSDVMRRYEDENGNELPLLHCLNDEFEILETPKAWKPKRGEDYYVISPWGKVIKNELYEYYTNTCNIDKEVELGDCFRTKEEADKIVEKIKIYTKLKRYAFEHNTDVIDFSKDTTKYYIEYNYDTCMLEIRATFIYEGMWQVYFTSEEIAKQAIEKIGSINMKILFEQPYGGGV